jgi:Stress responsive A/B Barrel Domain
MPNRVLRHVVLFSFNETATHEQVQEIERAFSALPEKIPAIHAFEWGTNVSIENASQGFSHCFLVTFLNEEDRGAYLPHPAHQAFGSVLQPHLAKVLVFDYWADSTTA